MAYPRGSEIREGVIAGALDISLCGSLESKSHHTLSAYDSTMKVMVLVATAVAVVPTILAFSMPDWYLGDTHNAIDEDHDPLLEEPLLPENEQHEH